jgi:hypothetical protein
MRERLLLCLAILVGVGIAAATGLADPNLSNVAPHRHFINGQQVGPDLCDNYDFVNHVATNAGIQKAFNEFHNNLHRATNPPPVGTNGPVAPGLHNGKGGELTFTAC